MKDESKEGWREGRREGRKVPHFKYTLTEAQKLVFTVRTRPVSGFSFPLK